MWVCPLVQLTIDFFSPPGVLGLHVFLGSDLTFDCVCMCVCFHPSLQQTIEAQKALIRRLRSLCFLAHSPDDPASPEPPSQPQTASSSPSPRLPPLPQSGFSLLSPSPSPPPPPPASSSSLYLPSPSASSCSSGRGSLSSTTTPPFLPHLTEIPHPHPPVSLCDHQVNDASTCYSAAFKEAMVLMLKVMMMMMLLHQASSVPCAEGNKLPIIPHPPSTRQRSNAGARTRQHDTSGQEESDSGLVSSSIFSHA